MTADAVIVGSGINALVAAAMLGRRGKRVVVLEREDRIGGCLRTDEITVPGFHHDVMATTAVLFRVGPAYADLRADLERHGLALSDSAAPTAVLRPGGEAAILRMDRDANAAMLDALAEGDGAAYRAAMAEVDGNAPLVFALLGQGLWTRQTATLLAREAWRRGPRNLAAFIGEGLAPARAWLESSFRSETARALFAPWVLHTGLGPDHAYSGQMARVIAYTLEAAGAPIVTGGAARLAEAFEGLIREQGGIVRTGADVERVLVRDGRARGVRLAGGEEIAARDVVASVTPTQLYRRLVEAPSEATQAATASYRYGKGNFQLHYALEHPPRWHDPALGEVALIHLTDGLDAVSKAAGEAERGIIPAAPTICVSQPTALDPSRAPEGRAILWLQMPEAPRRIAGDAGGEIPVPPDGQWSEDVREAFADRVEAMLAAHVAGFRDSVIARRAFSPADLEAMNVNLVGGDPYGGHCALDQFFLWRPFKGSVNHRTEIKGLWHIGASTHPGPGLGGGSGYLAAKGL